MAFELSVSEDEISEVLGICDESIEAGDSSSPELTYEEGVRAAIVWLFGMTEQHPFDDNDDDDSVEDGDYDEED